MESPKGASQSALVPILVAVGTERDQIGRIVGTAKAFRNDVVFMEPVPFDSAVGASHAASIAHTSGMRHAIGYPAAGKVQVHVTVSVSPLAKVASALSTVSATRIPPPEAP